MKLDTNDETIDLSQTMQKNKMLTINEASKLVSRLSEKQEHRKGCKCELCQAGGAVNHVRSFKPKKVRASYSRSKSRSTSAKRRGAKKETIDAD